MKVSSCKLAVFHGPNGLRHAFDQSGLSVQLSCMLVSLALPGRDVLLWSHNLRPSDVGNMRLMGLAMQGLHLMHW